MPVLGIKEEADIRFAGCKGDNEKQVSCGEAPNGSSGTAVYCTKLSRSDIAVAQTCDGGTKLLGR